MATSIELESNSASWDQHEDHGEHGRQSPQLELAQAATPGGGTTDADGGNAAPVAAAQAPAASSEPVPVDVGAPPALAGQQAPGQAATTTPPATNGEYVADASNVVHLPANASIDNIRVEGANLVLQQADGTVIVIKDGAINVPSFVVGDVEVPRVALLAALESNGVNVAFGADGSISAGPAAAQHNSAGGNFEHPAGDIGNGFDISALLPPTELRFGGLDRYELYAAVGNRDPHLADFAARPVSEEGLNDGNPDSDGSNDTTNATLIAGTFPGSDPDNDALSYVFGQPSSLTSGGSPVVWAGLGTGELIGSANGIEVIKITATGNSYAVELFGPIDHPNDSRPGAEDDLTFLVPVTATDGHGSSATANMAITIEDDGPAIASAVVGSSVTLDETANGPTSDGVLDPAIMTATSAAPIVTVTSDYGADGAGTTTYALSLTAANSGLQTAQGDHAITLVQAVAGGPIEGQYTDVGGTQTAFTVTLNADGTLKVVQNVALEHQSDGDDVTPAGSYNDALDLAGKIAVTATVTDADGDSASTAAIDVGSAVTFLDDGPAIASAVVGSSVTLDETANGPTSDGVLDPAIMTATSAAP
ncbi:DUF5801 repeats-in-toxin domain-containing protein, partial [Ollibium composti]